MIIPPDVSKAVAKVLNDNKATIGIEMSDVVGEKRPSTFVAPYAAIYFDTVEESSVTLNSGNTISVPFDLIVQVSSSALESIEASTAQAWEIAFKAYSLLLSGLIRIDNVPVPLKSQQMPFQIIGNTANQCLINVRLRFFLNKWD